MVRVPAETILKRRNYNYGHSAVAIQIVEAKGVHKNVCGEVYRCGIGVVVVVGGGLTPRKLISFDR